MLLFRDQIILPFLVPELEPQRCPYGQVCLGPQRFLVGPVLPAWDMLFHLYFSSDAQAFMFISDESYINAFLLDHPSPKCQENSKGQFFPSWTGTPEKEACMLTVVITSVADESPLACLCLGTHA